MTFYQVRNVRDKGTIIYVTMNSDLDKLNKQRCLLILAVLKHVFKEPEELRKHFRWVAGRKIGTRGATHKFACWNNRMHAKEQVDFSGVIHFVE